MIIEKLETEAAEMEERRQTKKMISGTVAVILAIAMALAGTYAFYYAPEKLANLVEGKGAGFPIFGHDDFVKQEDGTYNKDVYVENTGSTPAFVRVKLEEIFIHRDTLLCGKEVVTDAETGKTELVGKAHVPAVNTDITIGNTKEDQLVHQFFTWKMGRSAAEGPLYYLSAEAKTATDDPDYYYVAQEDKTEATEIFFENNIARNNSNHVYTDGETGVKAAPPCEVITMDAYMKLENVHAFTGWVIDTDGWCYWSQPLGEKQTTGLLLDAVQIKQPPQYDYTYRIDVTFQAVDNVDKNIWLDANVKQTVDQLPVTDNQEATENGKALLHILEGETKEVAQVMAKGDMAKSENRAGAYRLYYQAAAALKAGQTHQKGTAEEGEDYLGVYETRLAQAKAAIKKASKSVDLQGIDDNLRHYILDTYGDGKILTEDQAQAVTEIRITEGSEYGQVRTLAGLQIFENLDLIQCRNSAIPTADWDNLQKTDHPLYALGNRLKVLDLTGDQALTGHLVFSAMPELLVLNLDRTAITGRDWGHNENAKKIRAESIAGVKENVPEDEPLYFDLANRYVGKQMEYINFHDSKVTLGYAKASTVCEKLKYMDIYGGKLVTTGSSGGVAVSEVSLNLPILAYLDCRDVRTPVTTLHLVEGSLAEPYALRDIAGGWGVGVLTYDLTEEGPRCIVDPACQVYIGTALCTDTRIEKK